MAIVCLMTMIMSANAKVVNPNELPGFGSTIEYNDSQLKQNNSEPNYEFDYIIFLKEYYTHLIFLFIVVSSLIYWYSHRNDESTHPKLFWTLIFGWMYILYYVCDKKNL